METTSIPKSITLPIAFSTNKLTRRTEHRAPRPVYGYMELYFSRELVAGDDELSDGVRNSEKAREFYAKHNIYGEHKFLIPARRTQIEKYEAPWGRKHCIERIGEDPTIATYREGLQLIPCSSFNLELFKEKVLTEPFYLEIDEPGWWLHVKGADGIYRGAQSQDQGPRCWQGLAHEVVNYEDHYLFTFDQIPWHDIAKHLCITKTRHTKKRNV